MWTPVSAQKGPCVDIDWDAGPVLLLPRTKVEAQSAFFLPRNGPKWEVGAEPPGGAGMTQRQLLEAGGRDCRSAFGLRPAPGDGSVANRHGAGPRVWVRSALPPWSWGALRGAQPRGAAVKRVNEMMHSACGEQC